MYVYTSEAYTLYISVQYITCNDLRVSPVGARVSDVSCHTGPGQHCVCQYHHDRCEHDNYGIVYDVQFIRTHMWKICSAAVGIQCSFEYVL